mmetsp:Transcript_10856/g.19319  ORF Transcript_10856/g.19319 Transcript_10856/m.19319 type:complete len:180 (+) Transcript_10856:326-865(+)
MYGNKIEVSHFMEDVQPEREPVITPKYVGPMWEYEVPKELKYQPLTRCRMGFLIIFDANVEESLKTAMELFKTLTGKNSKDGKLPKGITVYLVANKIDKDPLNVQTKNNIESARIFAEVNHIFFMETSALKFIRVRKLFREMIEHITMQPQLWASDSLKAFVETKRGKFSSLGKDCGVM